MWFRLNDKTHSNTKVRRSRRSHPTKRKDAGAFGLWCLAAAWSADEKKDGFCPEEVLETFDDEWEDQARRLVAAVGPSGHGMFEGPVEVDGEIGYIVHDFLDYNDSRAKQLADAEADRIRKELYADPDLVAEIKARDRDRCRYCGCRVKWSDRRSPAGATFDHVVPVSEGGVNTLGNVVVCCRRCNGRKGKRSLLEAGMKLLRAGSKGAPVIDDEHDAAHTTTNGVTSSAGVPGRDGSGRDGGQNVPDTGTSSPTTHQPAAQHVDQQLAGASR